MRFGIRIRLLLAAALPATVVVSLLLFGFLDRYATDLVDALRDRGLASARQLGVAAEFPLFAGHIEGLQRLTEAAMAGDAQIQAAAIFGPDGKPRSVAGKFSTPLPRFAETEQAVVGSTLLIVIPVRAAATINDPFADAADDPAGRASKLLGYAAVEVSLELLKKQKRDLLGWALGAACVGLLIAVLLSSLIAAGVIRPIHAISDVVAQIGEGHLEARADVADAGALASLARGVNAMAVQVAVTQDELRHQVSLATEELRRQKEAAEAAARIDPLTGVASRRAFTEIAENEVLRASRYGSPLSLVMVDLDHFKTINDTYGHPTGDAVLVNFARTISGIVREVDVVGRLGGEEFAVLLPDTGAEEAVHAAERMRCALAESDLHVRGRQLKYSASFGVAAFVESELSLDEFLARADAALYLAKQQGRNRVVLAATPT